MLTHDTFSHFPDFPGRGGEGTLEELPDGRKILQSSLARDLIHFELREVKTSPSGRGTRKSAVQMLRDLSVVTAVSDIPGAQCG